MAEREEESRNRPVLLVGRGKRPQELGAVLAALAMVRASQGGGSAGKAESGFIRPHGLEDLEELLSQGALSGTLILESESVPTEDIGFVRRFLERHSGWRLIVLGTDPQDQRSRGLLGLARSQWLPWPPDLDQVHAILEGGVPSGSHVAPKESRPAAAQARARPRAAKETRAAKLSVGSLLEELVASASLEGGDESTRFEFSDQNDFAVSLDRTTLGEGFEGLLHLARRCAMRNGQVSAAMEEDANGAGGLVLIEFPLGPLTDGDLPGLLERPFKGSGELAESVESARQGAGQLRTLGARVELQPHGKGQLQLAVLLPDAAPPRARAGKSSATDPFA